MTAPPTAPTLRTERLLLRGWRPADRTAFAALNADPTVMEHFPAPLSRAGSDALAERIEAHFAAHGFGLWAVEVPGACAFAGFTGLRRIAMDNHLDGAVEVGWRLARAHWGQGYATEAARAALAFGFGALGLDEIVSFTTRGNARSRAVMERLGMRRDPAGDFQHPALPAGHAQRPHVLYRLPRSAWADASR